jgi:hypothetical protein
MTMAAELWLALLPEGDPDEPHSIKVFIINNSNYEVAIHWKWFFGTDLEWEEKNQLTTDKPQPLADFPFEDLNASPRFEAEVNCRTPYFKKSISQKIKPQNLFNKKMYVPSLQKEGFVYTFPIEIVEQKNPEEIKTEHEKVDAEWMREQILKIEPDSNKDVNVSNAVGEVDLHAEKLIRDLNGMDNTEILHIQLQHFERAMERAIANGLHDLYVIHGNGSGKLKSEIFRVLKSYGQHVKSYDNAFHPRYGLGATHIVIQ